MSNPTVTMSLPIFPPANSRPIPSTSSSTNPLPTISTPTPTLSVSTSERPTSNTTSQTTPPTTLSTPTTTTSQSTQTSLSTAAGGKTVTLTSVAPVTPTGSIGQTGTPAPGTSKTFFENPGAVAGVFTVVGLIVGLLITLAINTLLRRRRRRAKRFNREIEETAAEATAVPAPAFLDDDDPYRPRAYGAGAGASFGAGGYGHGGGDGYDSNDDGYSLDRAMYSDGVSQHTDVSSHGTFEQPAMSASGHPGETYGMRELGPSAEALYNPQGSGGIMAAGARATGIGVMRARSMREPGGYAGTLSDGGSPYDVSSPNPSQPSSIANLEESDAGLAVPIPRPVQREEREYEKASVSSLPLNYEPRDHHTSTRSEYSSSVFSAYPPSTYPPSTLPRYQTPPPIYENLSRTQTLRNASSMMSGYNAYHSNMAAIQNTPSP